MAKRQPSKRKPKPIEKALSSAQDKMDQALNKLTPTELKYLDRIVFKLLGIPSYVAKMRTKPATAAKRPLKKRKSKANGQGRATRRPAAGFTKADALSMREQQERVLFPYRNSPRSSKKKPATASKY